MQIPLTRSILRGVAPLVKLVQLLGVEVLVVQAYCVVDRPEPPLSLQVTVTFTGVFA